MSVFKAASAGKRKKKGRSQFSHPITKRKKSAKNETIQEFAIREKGGQK